MLSTNNFQVLMPSRAQSLYGLSIAVCVLSTAVLCLRFWSRWLLPQRRFQADDWTALLAWPLVVGTAICGAIAMRHGFGVHIAEIIASDPTILPSILKITYVGELTWTVGMGIIRSSAMLFYHRVFSHAGSSFRWFVIVGIVANILWSIILGFIVIFQCSPVNAYWDSTVKGRCLSTTNIELGSGISSIILDLYTLVLPMPTIWKLQMNRTKKTLTFATIALGYCVIITTIGRTVTVVKNEGSLARDFTWYFPNILYWIIIEFAIAHIGISLPSVFSLCRRTRWREISSLFMSRDMSTLVDSEDHSRSKETNMSKNDLTHRAFLREMDKSESRLRDSEVVISQESEHSRNSSEFGHERAFDLVE